MEEKKFYYNLTLLTPYVSFQKKVYDYIEGKDFNIKRGKRLYKNYKDLFQHIFDRCWLKKNNYKEKC